MAGTDIVFFYRDANSGEDYYGVRDLYDAWVAAGKPPINSAGRLYAVQKAARVAYLNGTGSPADDPDQPQSYELGHCRFAALDITATPERVRRLEAAGLVRPFSWESWHWRLPNIYNYPIVRSIPSTAENGSATFNPVALLEDPAMSNPIINVVPKYGIPASNGTVYFGRDDGTFEKYGPPYAVNDRNVLSKAFLGGDGSKDTIPTVSQADFEFVKRVWGIMRKSAAPVVDAPVVTPPKA